MVAVAGGVMVFGGVWNGLLQPVKALGTEVCGTPWVPRLPEPAPFVTGPTVEQCAYLADGRATSAAGAVIGGILVVLLAVLLDHVYAKVTA